MKKIDWQQYDMNKIKKLLLVLIIIVGVFITALAIWNRQITKKRAALGDKYPAKCIAIIENCGNNCNVEASIQKNCDGSWIHEGDYAANKEGEKFFIDFTAISGCQYKCRFKATIDEDCPDEKEATYLLSDACPICKLIIEYFPPNIFNGDNKFWDGTDNEHEGSMRGIKKIIKANFDWFKIGILKIKQPDPPDPNCVSECGSIGFKVSDSERCDRFITPSPQLRKDGRSSDNTYHIDCKEATSDEGATFILHQAKGEGQRCYYLEIKDKEGNICDQKEIKIGCPRQCINELIDDPIDPYDVVNPGPPEACDPDCNIETDTFVPHPPACINVGEKVQLYTNNKLDDAWIDFDDDFDSSGQGYQRVRNNREYHDYTYNDAGVYDIKLTCKNGTKTLSCTRRVSVLCGSNPPPPPPPPPGTGTPPPTTSLTGIPLTNVPYTGVLSPPPTPPLDCYEQPCENDEDCDDLTPPMRCVDVGYGFGKRCVINDGPCPEGDVGCWCLAPTLPQSPPPSSPGPSTCPVPNEPVVNVVCPYCCEQ